MKKKGAEHSPLGWRVVGTKGLALKKGSGRAAGKNWVEGRVKGRWRPAWEFLNAGWEREMKKWGNSGG